MGRSPLLNVIQLSLILFFTIIRCTNSTNENELLSSIHSEVSIVSYCSGVLDPLKSSEINYSDVDFDENLMKKVCVLLESAEIRVFALKECFLNSQLLKFTSEMFKSLTSFSLVKIPLEAIDIKELIDLLPESLESLEIDTCQESLASKIPINLSRFQSLKSLKLRNLSYSAIDFHIVFDSIESLHQLEVLDLEGCTIGADMFFLMKLFSAKASRHFANLLKLNLSKTKISFSMASSIIRMIYKCPKLTEFSIMNKSICCSEFIVKKLPKTLKKIDLRCSKLRFANNASHLNSISFIQELKLTELSISFTDMTPFEFITIAAHSTLEKLSLIDSSNQVVERMKINWSNERLTELKISPCLIIPYISEIHIRFPHLELLEIIGFLSAAHLNHLFSSISNVSSLKRISIDYTQIVTKYEMTQSEVQTYSRLESLTAMVNWEVFSTIFSTPFPHLRELVLIFDELPFWNINVFLVLLTNLPLLEKLTLTFHSMSSSAFELINVNEFPQLTYLKIVSKVNFTASIWCLVFRMPKLRTFEAVGIDINLIQIPTKKSIRFVHILDNQGNAIFRDDALGILCKLPQLLISNFVRLENSVFPDNLSNSDLSFYFSKLYSVCRFKSIFKRHLNSVLLITNRNIQKAVQQRDRNIVDTIKKELNLIDEIPIIKILSRTMLSMSCTLSDILDFNWENFALVLNVCEMMKFPLKTVDFTFDDFTDILEMIVYNENNTEDAEETDNTAKYLFNDTKISCADNLSAILPFKLMAYVTRNWIGDFDNYPVDGNSFMNSVIKFTKNSLNPRPCYIFDYLSTVATVFWADDSLLQNSIANYLDFNSFKTAMLVFDKFFGANTCKLMEEIFKNELDLLDINIFKLLGIDIMLVRNKMLDELRCDEKLETELSDEERELREHKVEEKFIAIGKSLQLTITEIISQSMFCYDKLQKIFSLDESGLALCPICLDLLIKESAGHFVYETRDGKVDTCHMFHNSCLETWLVGNSTCPLCRQKANLDVLI